MPATSSKRSLLIKLAIPLVIVAAIAGAFFAPALLKVQAPEFANAQPSGAPTVVGRAAIGEDFSALAKSLMPAVVNIYTMKAVKVQQHPLRDDPLFRFFFGEQPEAQSQPSTNLGSGVIVSESGYILTNNHVIDRASRVRVALENKGRGGKSVTVVRGLNLDPQALLMSTMAGGSSRSALLQQALQSGAVTVVAVGAAATAIAA